MGSLHEGHRSLIREAKSLCDRVIVSIFVNPTQFAEGEDLAEYPRDAEGDLTKAASAGADLVWFAQHEVIYPPDWGTTLVPKRVGLGLETDHRPHFFTGVATVVTSDASYARRSPSLVKRTTSSCWWFDSSTATSTWASTCAPAG